MASQTSKEVFFGKSGKSLTELQFSNELKADAIRKKAITKAAIVGGTIAGVGAAGLVGAGAAGAGAAAALKGAAAAGAKKAISGITLKKAAVGLTVAGVLSSSAKARKAAVELPQTLFKKGQTIGEIIEDPNKAKDILGISGDKSLGENIKSAAAKLGIAGVAAGTILGGVALAKKGIENIKAKSELEKLSAAEFVGAGKSSITNPLTVSSDSVAKTAATTPSEPQQEQINGKTPTNIIQIQVS